MSQFISKQPRMCDNSCTTGTKVGRIVCKSCECQVNRVKVVFHRTRSHHTVLEPLKQSSKFRMQFLLNRDQPCLTEYIHALLVHTRATFESNRYQRIPQARLELNTRTGQPVFSRVYRTWESCAQP